MKALNCLLQPASDSGQVPRSSFWREPRRPFQFTLVWHLLRMLETLQTCTYRYRRVCGIGKCRCWIIYVKKCSTLRVEFLKKSFNGFSIATSHSRNTNRDKKLLTMLGSTPVTKDGPISNGNVVALGFGTEEVDVDGCGTSNEIWAIASWSRTSSDVNRRAISLGCVSQGLRRYKGKNLLNFSPRPCWYSVSLTGLPIRISSRRCSSRSFRVEMNSKSFQTRRLLSCNDRLAKRGRYRLRKERCCPVRLFRARDRVCTYKNRYWNEREGGGKRETHFWCQLGREFEDDGSIAGSTTWSRRGQVILLNNVIFDHRLW